MKFCKYCGKELKENETCDCQLKEDIKKTIKKVAKKETKEEYKFCKFCGKKIRVNEVCDCQIEEETYQEKYNAIDYLKSAYNNAIEFLKTPVTTITKIAKSNDKKNTFILIGIYSFISALLMTYVLKEVTEKMTFGLLPLGGVEFDFIPILFRMIIAFYVIVVIYGLSIYATAKIFKKKTDFYECLNTSAIISIIGIASALLAAIACIINFNIMYAALFVLSTGIILGFIIAIKDVLKVEKDKIVYMVVSSMIIFDVLIYILIKIVGNF